MVYSYLKTSSYNYQRIVPFLLVVSIALKPQNAASSSTCSNSIHLSNEESKHIILKTAQVWHSTRHLYHSPIYSLIYIYIYRSFSTKKSVPLQHRRSNQWQWHHTVPRFGRTLSMASHSTFLGLLGLVFHGDRLDVVPLASWVFDVFGLTPFFGEWRRK